jgi:hypothetical protein
MGAVRHHGEEIDGGFPVKPSFRPSMPIIPVHFPSMAQTEPGVGSNYMLIHEPLAQSAPQPAQRRQASSLLSRGQEKPDRLAPRPLKKTRFFRETSSIKLDVTKKQRKDRLKPSYG